MKMNLVEKVKVILKLEEIRKGFKWIELYYDGQISMSGVTSSST